MVSTLAHLLKVCVSFQTIVILDLKDFRNGIQDVKQTRVCSCPVRKSQFQRRENLKRVLTRWSTTQKIN